MPVAPQKQRPSPPRKTTSTTTRISASSAVVNGDDSVWGATESLHMLIYGNSGSGKTVLASTFPEPLLWLICSGGNRPGELKSINTPENRGRITPKIVKTVAELPELIELGKSFATTVLDHASGLSDLLFKEILGLEQLPAQLGWGLATQQQYGQLALQAKEAFRALLSLQGNVVIIAQERVFGEEGASEIIKPTVGAALTPSVTGWLNCACDFVVQTFRKAKYCTETRELAGQKVQTEVRLPGVDYCLRTGPHDTFMTKFRRPMSYRELPEWIVNPTYQKLLSLIEGKEVE